MTPFRKALIKFFGRRRTGLSNHIANPPAPGLHWLRQSAQLALLLALSPLAIAADPGLKLQVGAHVFQVEIANTAQQREIGLMGRNRLDADAGMLFVFEQMGTHCFWMRNTLIPLSIAFLADDGSIVDIQDMQPQTLALHCPRAPIRYALEVPQRGFRNRGIQLGMQVAGGPFGSLR